MFEEGNIIYFDPFYFKNGNTAKPKYFVILKNIGQKNIIASLPTRRNSVPTKDTVKSGCVENPSVNFNCFVISEKQIITKCGKQFDFTTFIYGHQLDDYDTEMIRETYPVEGSDYIIWGKMKTKIYQSLIECLKTSKTVKRKYKKLL